MKKAKANNPEAYFWNIPFMGFLNMNKHCPVFMNKNDCFRVSVQRLRSSDTPLLWCSSSTVDMSERSSLYGENALQPMKG